MTSARNFGLSLVPRFSFPDPYQNSGNWTEHIAGVDLESSLERDWSGPRHGGSWYTRRCECGGLQPGGRSGEATNDIHLWR